VGAVHHILAPVCPGLRCVYLALTRADPSLVSAYPAVGATYPALAPAYLALGVAYIWVIPSGRSIEPSQVVEKPSTKGFSRPLVTAQCFYLV
jgi:hypothetical protein